MLTDYFKSPITLERYRSRLIGPHLDAFTAWLDEHGYRRVSIRRHVREVTHFSAWAETARIPVEGLNQDALDRLHCYLAKREQLRYRNGGLQHIYQSACVFVGFFEATGVVDWRHLRQHQLQLRIYGVSSANGCERNVGRWTARSPVIACPLPHCC
jgi:hypothetical protein